MKHNKLTYQRKRRGTLATAAWCFGIPWFYTAQSLCSHRNHCVFFLVLYHFVFFDFATKLISVVTDIFLTAWVWKQWLCTLYSQSLLGVRGSFVYNDCSRLRSGFSMHSHTVMWKCVCSCDCCTLPKLLHQTTSSLCVVAWRSVRAHNYVVWILRINKNYRIVDNSSDVREWNARALQHCWFKDPPCMKHL